MEVGRDLWRWSSPTTLPNQSHLELVAQDYVQTAFEYLQGGTLQHLSGQPVPVFSHPHSKKVFPDIRMESPVIHFVPIASGPFTGHRGKEPDSVLFTPSLQVFIDFDDIPHAPSFVQAKQFFNFPATLFLTWTRISLAFFARAHCWLLFNLMSTKTPAFFWKAGWPFQLDGHQHGLVHGIFLSPVWDFALSLSELHQIPVNLFLQPVMVFLHGSMTPWHISRLSQFYVICKLAEGTLCPIIQIVNEDINNIGPSSDPWGTPLLFCNHKQCSNASALVIVFLFKNLFIELGLRGGWSSRSKISVLIDA